MKLGVFADIHGNAPALEAVLDSLDKDGVDAIACPGDIVGVLGSPDTCVSLIRRHTDYVALLLGFRLETSKSGVEYQRGTLNSSESAPL